MSKQPMRQKVFFRTAWLNIIFQALFLALLLSQQLATHRRERTLCPNPHDPA
jgi:hypothetical protein